MGILIIIWILLWAGYQAYLFIALLSCVKGVFWKMFLQSFGVSSASNIYLSRGLSSSELHIIVFIHIVILPRYLNDSLCSPISDWFIKNMSFSWSEQVSSIKSWFSFGLGSLAKFSKLRTSRSGNSSKSWTGAVGWFLKDSSCVVKSNTVASSSSTFFSSELIYSFFLCLKIWALALFFSLRCFCRHDWINTCGVLRLWSGRDSKPSQ